MSISVVMPAYNVAEVIGGAIDSALAQTRPVDEIVVVDDASRDSTADVVLGLAKRHPQIRLIRLEANGGTAHARNVGIVAARGDWIAQLDADDSWAPERICVLLAVAQEQHADLVADNLVFFDLAAGKVARHAFRASWRTHVVDTEDFFRSRTPSGSGVLTYGLLKPVMSRRFLADKRIGYDSRLRLGSDFRLFAELLLAGGKAVLCNAPLYTYVQPIGEISRVTSGNSRTAYNRWGELAESVAELAVTYRPNISPPVRVAMTRRLNDWRVLTMATVAGDLRKARQYWRCFRFISSRPELAAYLFRTIPTRLERLRRHLFYRLTRPRQPGLAQSAKPIVDLVEAGQT